MNRLNRIVLLSLISFSIPIFGMNHQIVPELPKLTVNVPRLSLKLVVGMTTSLAAHNALEYISTLIHEHGHGLASLESYKINLKYTKNILDPWEGTAYYKNPTNNFHNTLATLAGPVAGISATYIQCIGIKFLDNFIHKYPLEKAFTNAKQYPLSFFMDSIQTGKKYSAYLLNKNHTTIEPSWSSVALNCLMFLRCARIIGEAIHGFLPYSKKFKVQNQNDSYHSVDGDGYKVWKKIFGQNCPTFGGSIIMLSSITLFPFIFGAMLSLFQ